MFHALLHFMGVLPRTPSSAYNFWSGFGSDIGEAAIIGGLVAAYRKHNCHEPGCWRLGKHPAANGLYVLCRKHHPDVPDQLTHDHIADAHAQANS